MSWKAEMSDDGGKSFASDLLRFASKEEAERYAKGLFSRWTMTTNWRVGESADPVTDRCLDDGSVIKI